ncbi:hypothetical protein PDE_08419 [Penicillium oxalicum 114-2]|uniref:Arrestin C-terminal-like domain-containing protein n=1 Tax=Penicillium oxalicum (strain 114-2 / CGMCC 5302) TaxID=933388 RepID=S8BEH6_PENO1|nr:hypothetical protein PDE_08419 [Penicillium oxalicum 114-2]
MQDAYPVKQELKARGGISLEFILFEPVVFLQGDVKRDPNSPEKPALIRGRINLHAPHPIRLKSFSVSFHGKACLKPFGNNARTQDVINSSITYAEDGHLISTDLDDYSQSTTECTAREHAAEKRRNSAPTLMTRPIAPPEYDAQDEESFRRRSISGYSRDSVRAQVKGRQDLLPAGNHTFPFEFVVLNLLPESIDTYLLSIRYYLEARIEFGGFFGSKLTSQLHVPIVRLPPEGSLEMTEPVTLMRDWSKNLHYHFFLLGRSFRLGSQIPIRLGLLPLVPLKCIAVQVLIQQHIRYWDIDRTNCLIDSGKRTILLLEKNVGAECRSVFAGGNVHITKEQDKTEMEDLKNTSLLGSMLQPCQIEMHVQLPRCPDLKQRPSYQRIHASSTIGRLDVSHWIQVVLRLSLNDTDSGISTTGRSISQRLTLQTPITIRSCKATASNIYPPPYTFESGLDLGSFQNTTCDCQSSATPFSFPDNSEMEDSRPRDYQPIESVSPYSAPLFKCLSPCDTPTLNTEELGT